jgi:predicted dehydrogenase
MAIRVGLIGLNYGAEVHLPAFKASTRYELVAVCARTPGRAEAVAREHNIPNWYTEPRRLLASDVDLIAIASPPPTHAGYAAAALAAGKHVLVEVAYVGCAADARVLAELAHEHKRVGVVAFVLPYVPTLRHVADVLAEGTLGEPRLLHMDFYSDFLAREAGAFPWLWEAEYGGGILANFVAHGVNLATRLFGAVRAVDATLVTRAALPSLPAGVTPADDTGLLALHFERGMMATFSFSAVVAPGRNQIALHGSAGSLIVEGFGEEAELLGMGEARSRPLYPPMAYLEETRGQNGLTGGMAVLLERLAAVITDGAPARDLPTLAAAYHTQRLLDAARLSAREHRQVLMTEVR